jgi:hypothetical protein
MLTGRHPNTTGVFDNSFISAPLILSGSPAAVFQGQWLRRGTGKIFHGGIDDTDAWTTAKRVDQKPA